MAVFDIRSNLDLTNVFDLFITSDGVDTFNINDNGDSELGLMFYGYMRSSSAGTHTISYLQSETGAFAGEEIPVPDANIIGATMVFNLALGDFVVLTQGLFGTFRFVQGVITSTSVGGPTRLIINAIEGVEQKPFQDDVIGN